ncbi:MAG: hypothetical protein IIA67_08175, partial [Planctomycetes bacterium]|nr:hypothetical protein [Planctomycetota bacterium]
MKRKYRYHPKRRGVLILVVLSLLVLFTLITITYVVVSRQAMSSSQTANRYEQVRPDNKALLHGALMQMLVGTENRHSVLLGHSLGGDMYGTWLTGTVGRAGAMSATDNQFVQLQVTVDHLDTDPDFPNVEDYYRGRVLTMIDGPAAGLSTRIVFSSENENTLHVMAFGRTDPNGVIAVVPEQGNRFLINGREFAGVRPSLDNMQALEPSLLAVNLSSALYGENDNVVLSALARVNETYDAVDFLNMLLGRFPEDPWIGRPENAPQPAEAWERRIIPSLHRPALIRFVGNGGDLTTALLRPNPKFHYLAKDPNDGNIVIDFTGKRYVLDDLTDGFDPSQKIADLVNGPWDVDTDGDGILDAVWVDLGYPVLKTADGRSYKPLFAIRCQDLDGRVNVNAHGSKAQTELDYEEFRGTFADGDGQVPPMDPIGLWKGQGVSPAEINPSWVFADPMTGVRRSYDAHLEMMEERYGDDGKPGKGAWTADRRSRIGPFRMPDLFDPNAGALNKSYGTPPDRQGRRYVGLDPRGQPIYSNGMPFQEFSGTLRDPHRMVLTRFSPVGPSDGLAPD